MKSTDSCPAITTPKGADTTSRRTDGGRKAGGRAPERGARRAPRPDRALRLRRSKGVPVSEGFELLEARLQRARGYGGQRVSGLAHPSLQVIAKLRPQIVQRGAEMVGDRLG